MRKTVFSTGRVNWKKWIRYIICIRGGYPSNLQIFVGGKEPKRCDADPNGIRF